jgi:hypothetical protein
MWWLAAAVAVVERQNSTNSGCMIMDMASDVRGQTDWRRCHEIVGVFVIMGLIMWRWMR